MKSNYTGLPSVVFTIPPLASVGLREKDAIEQGLHFRTNHNNTSKWILLGVQVKLILDLRY